jgi:midasin
MVAPLSSLLLVPVVIVFLTYSYHLIVCFQGLHLFLDATRVSYRFLELEPRVFCEQWDWSCFLDLVDTTADYLLPDDPLYSVGLDFRWCSIQILMVVLKASDRGIASFGLRADAAFTCLLRFPSHSLFFVIVFSGS